MEGVTEKQTKTTQQSDSSYTYWVREMSEDAMAPKPVPQKLTPEDISAAAEPNNALGSVWNKAGTWEEKNLNSWASSRIKELLACVGSLDFSTGKAEITEVSKCVGDAFLVTVRNKKRVGYTYELTLKFKGEWLIQEENKGIEGHLDIVEFSFGELDDLQIEVMLSQDKDLVQQDKWRIIQDVKLFLRPIGEKLLQFEQELKERGIQVARVPADANGCSEITSPTVRGAESSALQIEEHTKYFAQNFGRAGES